MRRAHPPDELGSYEQRFSTLNIENSIALDPEVEMTFLKANFYSNTEQATDGKIVVYEFLGQGSGKPDCHTSSPYPPFPTPWLLYYTC
jgi:hypothetical protein